MFYIFSSVKSKEINLSDEEFADFLDVLSANRMRKF